MEYLKNSSPKIEKVSIVKCNSYNQRLVDKAVREAFKLIRFNPLNRTKVLLKPNIVMLGENKKQNVATITHPSVVEAVCKFLKENECTIYIGESSFMNTDCFMKQAGITSLAKKYAKRRKSTIFEQEKLITINNKKAKILKSFEVAKVLKEVDYIINMPKMKTHLLAGYTGAIKNIYGVIPGGMKQKLHNKAQGERRFSELLVDIYQNIKPQINLMDGIIGMEGKGPTSGNPKKAGLILASENGVALDIVATKIMGYNPKRIWHIREAVRRGLYKDYWVEIEGMKKIPKINFKKPVLHGQFAKLKSVFREKPIVCDTAKCIKCRACAKHCPAQAITLKPFPIINRKKCIRCFCCMEICPVHALSLEEKKK